MRAKALGHTFFLICGRVGRKTGTYHHGNLKHDLIEAGIKLLNEGGEATLSLRAVAAECKVSHAAPYNHFSDKEALMQAINDYVMQRFLMALQEAVDAVRFRHEKVFSLGCAYVHFFMENPQYYSFFYLRRGTCGPRVILREDGALDSGFEPFLLFQCIVQDALTAMCVPPAMHAERTLEMWTTLQGVTALFVLDGFGCPDDEEALKTLLRSRLHVK